MSDETIDNGTADEFDDFLSGIEANPKFAATSFVKIMSTAGGATDVPVDPAHTVGDIPVDQGGQLGYTINEILELANFAVSPATEFWVNGTKVGRDFVVTAGANVTTVGSVKGGLR